METRVQTVCLVLISTVLVGAALRWLSPMMVPFVLAVFITVGLSAMVEWLESRLRMPRWLARTVTLLSGVVVLGIVASLVSTSVSQLSESASVYNEHLNELILEGASLASIDLETSEGQFQALSKIPVATVGGLLARTANAVMDLLANSLVVVIFVLFLMLGPGHAVAARGMWNEAEKRIKRYLVTKAAISLGTGFLVGLTLTILGVPLAYVFGLLAFLLNFIPSVGSILATLLPVPIVIVSPEVTGGAAVLAIVIPGFIQLTIGNFVEPTIMGESLDLHPVAILLSLILWGMLWGIVGMILSVPIMVVVKILCERSEGSRPIASLLAGRLDELMDAA